MAIVVAVFQAIVGALVTIPQVSMKAAMISPAHAVPMGAGVLIVDPVVVAIVSLLKAIVLPAVAITTVVVRRRGRRHAQRDRRSEHRQYQFPHDGTPFNAMEPRLRLEN